MFVPILSSWCRFWLGNTNRIWQYVVVCIYGTVPISAPHTCTSYQHVQYTTKLLVLVLMKSELHLRLSENLGPWRTSTGLQELPFKEHEDSKLTATVFAWHSNSLTMLVKTSLACGPSLFSNWTKLKPGWAPRSWRKSILNFVLANN